MVAPRILLIDDHALFRSGMRMVLEAEIAGVQVLEAESLAQALKVALEPPTLALLDIHLQGVSGLEGLGLLGKRWPGVPVVMLSSALEPQVQRDALARGAVAFVSKAESVAKIVQVIGQVLGDQQLGPLQASREVNRANQTKKQVVPRLTPRQCEVLDLLCEGLSNKLIARRLVLSEFTVRGHVQAVLGLLEVSSRSQAQFAARRMGLVG